MRRKAKEPEAAVNARARSALEAGSALLSTSGAPLLNKTTTLLDCLLSSDEVRTPCLVLPKERAHCAAGGGARCYARIASVLQQPAPTRVVLGQADAG